jgi:hypothetical protein
MNPTAKRILNIIGIASGVAVDVVVVVAVAIACPWVD